MAVSQNGYTANDRTVITSYTVSDSGRKMSLRKGSPGELLAHFIRWFDASVRDIDPGIMDDWSYAERPIRGGTQLSNHASGTAADVDATKWPLGVQPEAYLTAAEIAKVRQQLRLYEGCIRWGGDYAGRKDPMHFEIDRDQASCDRVWAKLQSQPEDDDMYTDDDRKRDDEIARFVEWFGKPDDDPATKGVDESQPNSKGELAKRIRDIHGLVAGQSSAITALAKLLAEQNGLTLADVRRVVAEEVAKGVDVDVTVTPGNAG